MIESETPLPDPAEAAIAFDTPAAAHEPADQPPPADAMAAADVDVNGIPLHDDYVPQEFRSHDDWGPQVVQQGYYFVMGDHRNNSSDSRHWGPVPKKYIVGKVKVRWWPLQDAKIF